MQAFAPVAPPYRPGDVVGGRYEIRSLLDQGGSSEVYLATDRVLRRQVVIKAPRAGLLRDPRAVSRFRHEAMGLARVSHPALVTVHDVGLDPNGPYLVEEFVPGRSLAQFLRDQGPLPPLSTGEIGAVVADALAAVHAAGMLHRDLKPGNLMLTPTGGVKVLDLGIAWAADWTPLSGVGEILGTAAYVSPEQIAGGPIDARSDLYSLGVVLYEMLTGRPPFSGTTLELLDHHARQAPRPLRSIRGDVPERLADVVERCLDKDPDRRPATARMLANELRASVRQDPDMTRSLPRPNPTERLPVTQPGPRRGRRVGLAAAAVLVFVVAFVVQTLPRADASLRPPAKIEARGACDGFLKYRITVSWQPASLGDGYVVFRRALPRGRWTRAAVLGDPSATTFADHGLGADTMYGYQVRATEGDRMSRPSHPVAGGTPLFCFG